MWWWLACATQPVPEVPVDSGTTDPRPFPEALVGDADAGALAFQVHCASCHGPEGRGALGADLAVASVRYDDPGLFDVLIDGRRAMPAIRLDDQEAMDIIAHLRVWFPQ